MGSLCGKKFPKEFKVLLLGPEDAGKTSLLYQIKMHEKVVTIPTLGFNVENVTHKKANFLIFDLGKFETGSPKEFYEGTDFIIYVVDSTDERKLYEASKKLSILLDDEELKDAGLAIAANKNESKNALDTYEIIERLELKRISRNWTVIATTGITGEGTKEILDYMVEYFTEKYLKKLEEKDVEPIKKKINKDFNSQKLEEEIKEIDEFKIMKD